MYYAINAIAMLTTNYTVKNLANHVGHSQTGITFNRHSPDADTVSEHILKETTHCDITIGPQDMLCFNYIAAY